MAQLTCKNLSIGYDSKIILNNINFEVNSGDYICIVGENGSGKSTLMKTIIGLQPMISGKVFTGDGLKFNEIGYMPQQTAIQKDFPASVREIVLSGCHGRCGMHPFYNEVEKMILKYALQKMKIEKLSKHCYRELSGGQQQRVLLARALCSTQKMLLLDEPVSGLDSNVALEMYNLIEELNRKDNITIIMITHDIESALKYASHIMHIGKNIFYGTKQDYINNKKIKNFENKNGGYTNE